MDNRIKATLTSKTGKTLKQGVNRVDLKDGYCVHPFTYKNVQYRNGRCYKASKDEYWCATSVKQDKKNPDIKDKLATWAYCDFEGKPRVKTKRRKLKPKDPKTPVKKTIKRKKIVKNVEPANISKTQYKLPIQSKIKSDKWILPNRKEFINWFDNTYKLYIAKSDASLSKSEKVDYFNHQKLVRDYIQIDSPYRGILLYHGLGVGKTCASIAIAEGFKSNRKINVLLNKSLKQNYIVNLMFCGDDYFRTNQHWEYKEFKSNQEFHSYAKFLKIPIKNRTGLWFINFDKAPNYNELSTQQRETLNAQIIDMINSRYNFIHLDGLNEKRLLSMIENRVLDNSVLVIDEVHNLTNAMAKEFPGVRGKYLKQLIMDAENLKLVFLSGTPMINNLYEVGQLFNLLRGWIHTFNYVIKPLAGKTTIPVSKIEEELNKYTRSIDQFFIEKKDNLITITRNPIGFINSTDNNGELLRNPTENIETNDEFNNNIIRAFETIGYGIHKQYREKFNALPDDNDGGESFMAKFYDPVNNKVINQELFKSRILGLVSYYRTQSKKLLPTVRTNQVVLIPMSEYQFGAYSKVRKVEKKQEKSKATKSKGKKPLKGNNKDNIFEAKSSFRSYSRMHCSFVFPETIERPLPGNSIELASVIDDIEYVETQEERDELLSSPSRSGSNTGAPNSGAMAKAYELAKRKVLKLLEKQASNLLIKDEPEKLMKYSPKYNAILNKIEETNGLAFVYTEYKTLEGIAIFSIILKANGYAPFLIKKNDMGVWENVFDNDEDRDKPKFAFWGGDEETSDIIRKIYNNDFKEIPTSLQKQLKGRNNLHGEIIKILLTTKTGAEGIDLKNVRQVHIVEPYWNPVRLKQVKGRAVRVGSHIQLPEAERNVDIFTYLSVMTKEQLEMDKTLMDDFGGKSSDQVLFDISKKKLEIMETVLRMIKEVSVDCSLNYSDTYNVEEPFTCMNFGTQKGYASIPNINKEYIDTERNRRVKKVEVKYVKFKLKSKKGITEYYKKISEYPQLFYSKAAVESKRPGEPIGEIQLINGKNKPIFYKK